MTTFVIKDKNLKPENIKSGVKILKVTGTYEGSGPGDCEEWPSLLGVSNMQNPTHAGVIFDTGFPIAGLINNEFEGYFTLGSPDSDYFLLGNRSNVDPDTGHAYYWGIWKYDTDLMVSFGAEALYNSAMFTLGDEVSAVDLPISWMRQENRDYGSSADEYGTEYIYEVKVGNMTKYAPAFDDRLDFFEGLNVCVFGRNSYEYPGEYGTSAPSGSQCSKLWLSSTDGDDVPHTITLEPYIKNGTVTFYKFYDIDEESIEEPLEPVLQEGAIVGNTNFDIDYYQLVEITPSTEEQHVATVSGSAITPYVTVNPMNLVSTSETITENGQVVISAGDYRADGLSEITLDVSVGGSGGSDWLVDALAGNITDLSGYELPGSTRDYQYFYLFRNAPIVKGPSFSDSSLNGEESCKEMFRDCSSLTDFSFGSVQEINNTRACNYMFQNCTSLTNVDLSNLQYISGQEACYAMFSGCSSLTSIDLSNLRTIYGEDAVRFMLSGTQITSLDLSNLVSVGFNAAQYNFLNNITELTINPAVLTSSSQYYNVIKSGTLIEDLYFSANATDNVYLSWQPNLTAASVLNVLTHLDLTVSGKSVNFYSSGLTVTDDAQGSIQTAYDAAVTAGWTINNLTIVQP